VFSGVAPQVVIVNLVCPLPGRVRKGKKNQGRGKEYVESLVEDFLPLSFPKSLIRHPCFCFFFGFSILWTPA
jgi:hypothetical protein